MNQRRRYKAKRRRRLRRLYGNLAAALAAWHGLRRCVPLPPFVMPAGAVRDLFNPSAASVAAYYRTLSGRIR